MIISRNSYDFLDADLIPVIASFDTEGHIKPLYVRIGEDSFKVHSSCFTPGPSPVISFDCQIIDNGILKPIKLRFHREERVWSVARVSGL